MSSDDPATRAGALRLLAGVQATTARRQSRAAGEAFAQISADGANLSHRMAAIDSINEIIGAHSDDGSSIVEALRDGAATIQTSQAALTARIAEMRTQREAYVEAANVAHDRAAGLFDQARQADEAGFAATAIDAKQSALQSAYAAQIGGEAARLEAQTAEIAAENLAGEIAPLEAEAALWSTMATRVADLQQQQTAESDADRTTLSASEKARVLGVQELVSAYEEQARRFRSDVVGPAGCRGDVRRRSRKKVRRGRGIDQRPQRPTYRGVRQVLRPDGIDQRADPPGDLCDRFCRAGSDPGQQPGRWTRDAAAAFSAEQESLKTEAAAAAERARALIEEGTAYTVTLAEDPELGAAAASLGAALQGYSARLPG